MGRHSPGLGFNRAVVVLMLLLCGCSQQKPVELFTYPEGKTKALIMSYDDGTVDDMRLTRLFDRYGIIGTFNLNSGYLGSTRAWPTEHGDSVYQQYMPLDSIAAVYRKHEIAAHGVYHKDLRSLNEEEIHAEIEADIHTLRELTGHPIRSMAYSFGSTSREIARLIRATELTNARTINDTHAFGIPDDPYRWDPTCHDSRALASLENFLALPHDQLSLFYVWGHSWEFKDPQRWDAIQVFCKSIGNREDIWYVGSGDFIDYLAAIDRVTTSNGKLVNPSDNVSVWVRMGRESVVLEPGAELRLP